MLDFYNEREPVARKPHECYLCGKEIGVGTKYARICYKSDGFGDVCLHTECRSLVDEYCNNCGENEYVQDDVDEYLQEEYCWAICDDEQRDSCTEDIFHCPLIQDARKAVV